MRALIAGAGSMSPVQRTLLDELAKTTTFDVAPIAAAVLAEPGLDDDMARAVLALLRT